MLIDILVEALSLPVQTLIFICVATLIAAVVQGAAGIGYGLIAAPVFAFLAPQMVPGVILSTGLIITFLAVVREIKHVDVSLLTAGVVGRVPGSLLGALCAALLAPQWFGIAFGLLLLFAVGISLTAPRIPAKAGTVLAAGAVSGLMGTITSVGAPPMAIALQNQPGKEMRATMSAFLFAGGTISIIALSLFDRFNFTDLARGILLVPICLIGFWVSSRLVAMSVLDQWLKPIVLAICVVMSLLLLSKSVASIL